MPKSRLLLVLLASLLALIGCDPLTGSGRTTLRIGTGGHTGLIVTGNRFGPAEPHWGGECLFVSVTPAKSVDNLRMSGGQARGCPVIP